MNLTRSRHWELVIIGISMVLAPYKLQAADRLPLDSPKIPPRIGEAMDVAPWGERSTNDNGKTVNLVWEDLRDIYRVKVTFKSPPPDPATVKLQWWQSRWPDGRIPRDRLSGEGGSGWLNIADWYQGRWREADAIRAGQANSWTYTFTPVNWREFANLKNLSAPYRSTMKLRLVFSAAAPEIELWEAFSDSTWKSEEMEIEWGGSTEPSQNWDGRLEVFNGYAEAVAPLNPRTTILPGKPGWNSSPRGQTSGIRTRVWHTTSTNVNSFDKTVVTVRARQHSFSFDASEVAKGVPVFAPMYGILVHRAKDGLTYSQAYKNWQARATKPLYERVFDVPEQSYTQARADMPPKRQFYFPVGCEGGRQRFGVEPDGSVFCVNDRIDRPRGQDTARRVWGGNRLRYSFGLPAGIPAERWIEDDCLPIIHAQWEQGGIRYTQTAFATRLEAGGLGWPDMQADDTTVLMLRIESENRGGKSAQATLQSALQVDGQSMPLNLREGLAYAQLSQGEVVRYALDGPASALLNPVGKIDYSERLAPGAKRTLIIKIPFITLDQRAELDRLKNLSFDDEFNRVRNFWRQRADQSCQIRTPDKEISSFYRAVVSHLLINCGREVKADRLMARVGGFSYGVYGNESCMMITDLDRRGLHQEAERCLETFLHYQGTSPLPGEYLSQEAVFNGAGGWESGGYNQHHGWILWAMAEHYWHTGDRTWLQRNAPKLIKACRWIIRERARSQAFPADSLRGIERGLLPHGSLEDIADWRCWLSNNVFSWWGLDALAKALADINHPEAKELLAEAEAYRADMLAAFKEAMIRSPLVRLRDGSSIPAIPSEVHRRGRTFGWITTTLEGPIYLIRTGAIAPNDPLALCIMQDYEDNLYLSEQFGYSPKYIPEHWFSRGGFSQQPNLLCSPIPYLMRDEIKHYLRSYFNAFAVGFYQHTKMLTEHPLPDLGDWRGDHYKSSDESNSTYWLRLMFIAEHQGRLFLGQAIPRMWLADGNAPAIERAATHFGPMSLRFESHAAQGSITAILDPPVRRVPEQTWLRFRHPQGATIKRVTIDGKSWDKFDAQKEWIELPILKVRTSITAYY